MKKKIQILCILTLVLIVISGLCACGDKEDKSSAFNSTKTIQDSQNIQKNTSDEVEEQEPEIASEPEYYEDYIGRYVTDLKKYLGEDYVIESSNRDEMWYVDGYLGYLYKEPNILFATYEGTDSYVPSDEDIVEGIVVYDNEVINKYLTGGMTYPEVKEALSKVVYVDLYYEYNKYIDGDDTPHYYLPISFNDKEYTFYWDGEPETTKSTATIVCDTMLY